MSQACASTRRQRYQQLHGIGFRICLLDREHRKRELCDKTGSRTSFDVHPLWLLLVSIVLCDLRQYLHRRNPFTDCTPLYSDFLAFKGLGALITIALVCKQGGSNRDDLVLNLGEHCLESTRDTFVSFEVYVSFALAVDMLWVEWVVDNRARDPIRKFRNTSSDEVVDVERDSSHRSCFVAG